MGQYKSPSETVSQHQNLPESYHINKWNNLPQGIPIRSCCLCEWGAQEIIMLWILYRRIPLFSWFFFIEPWFEKKNLSYSLYLGMPWSKQLQLGIVYYKHLFGAFEILTSTMKKSLFKKWIVSLQWVFSIDALCVFFIHHGLAVL